MPRKPYAPSPKQLAEARKRGINPTGLTGGQLGKALRENGLKSQPKPKKQQTGGYHLYGRFVSYQELDDLMSEAFKNKSGVVNIPSKPKKKY